MRYRGPTPAFWAFLFALALFGGTLALLGKAFGAFL